MQSELLTLLELGATALQRLLNFVKNLTFPDLLDKKIKENRKKVSQTISNNRKSIKTKVVANIWLNTFLIGIRECGGACIK